MAKKHSTEVRRRAFAIWQKLGYLPWRKPRQERERKAKKGSGDFYKGAFDSIPFLNNDAKRTFQHLLLRPGYMIRDYLSGQHERYLAPLTALIIFYAFFALISSVLQPYQQKSELSIDSYVSEMQDDDLPDQGKQLLYNISQVVRRGYVFLNLDRYPEEVDSQGEAAVAALEGTLRSQGIPLFLGEFLLLWLATSISLKRYRLGKSACAAISAYILCQFSFFMLFALLLTWGRNASLGAFLMLLLLTVDFRQLLDVKTGRALRLAIRTGLWYLLIYVLVLLVLSGVALLLAWLKL